MKRTLLVVSLTALVVLGVAAFPAHTAEGESEQVHPKVWSLVSLLKLAEQGEFPSDFETPLSIPSQNGRFEDTPDVPITDVVNRTLSENSIFVSPLDDQFVFCANNSTDWPVSQVFGTQVGWSTDGGQTWTSQNEGPGGERNSGDPAAVIDRDERLIVGYVDRFLGQGVSYSTNMGASWTHVTVASVPGSGVLDKNHLTVDNVETSPFEGRLYSAWTEFSSAGSNNNDIVLSYSPDGDNWSSLKNLSAFIFAGSHSQGVNVQTGPNGEVYAAWTIYDSWPSDETAIGFNSSTDGGVSWVGEERILSDIRGIRITTLPHENTRANSYPVMAVDVSGGERNGWIYIVWTNQGVPGVNVGDADIYMIRSTDGGSSWETPVRVNTDATENSQWFPWISCDTDTGDLFVIFYDRRDDPGNLLTATYVAQSTNGGDTWEDYQVSDVQFTPAPIPGLATGYMGDYLGIDAAGSMIYPIFGDWRTSNFMSYVSPFEAEGPTLDPPTSAPDVGAHRGLILAASRPNPLARGTAISFSLPVGKDVSLEIYDVTGRCVRTLVDGFREAGTHSVFWNGRDGAGERVPAGVYLYELRSGGVKKSRKMLLVE
jgi:hypothetical protein